MKILYMCNFISIVHIPFVCGEAITSIALSSSFLKTSGDL